MYLLGFCFSRNLCFQPPQSFILSRKNNAHEFLVTDINTFPGNKGGQKKNALTFLDYVGRWGESGESSVQGKSK